MLPSPCPLVPQPRTPRGRFRSRALPARRISRAQDQAACGLLGPTVASARVVKVRPRPLGPALPSSWLNSVPLCGCAALFVYASVEGLSCGFRFFGCNE